MSRLLLSISPGERYEARRALRRCPRIAVSAGESLSAADVPTARLLVVERGVVLLVSPPTRSRRPAVLTLAGAGALVPPPLPDERLAGLTDALLTAVTSEAYDALLMLPEVAGALVDGLLDELRDRQESLANARRGVHAERLRDKLFQLARVHGRVGPDGVQIELPLTHELLAQMVGSARETVTSTLARFRREGFLVRDDRGYRLTVSPSVLEPPTAAPTGRGNGRRRPA